MNPNKWMLMSTPQFHFFITVLTVVIGGIVVWIGVTANRKLNRLEGKYDALYRQILRKQPVGRSPLAFKEPV